MKQTFILKRILAGLMAGLLCLSSLCIMPLAAADAIAVSEGKLTRIVFGEVFSDTDKGKTFGGNLYLEKNLGPVYFDGVRTNDWFEFKINAEKATKWLNDGAQPTETVRTLLKKTEIIK